MDMLGAVVVPIVTSSVVVGILVFALRKYIAEAISLEFKKRADQEAADRERERRREDAFFEKRFGIYPEINDITYRITKTLQTNRDNEFAYEWNGEFPFLAAHLTELLFRYRFFLPEPLFEKLHELKRLAQDVVLLVDAHTRESNMFDAEAFCEARRKIFGYAGQADVLYADIRQQLENIGIA